MSFKSMKTNHKKNALYNIGSKLYEFKNFRESCSQIYRNFNKEKDFKTVTLWHQIFFPQQGDTKIIEEIKLNLA